MNLYKIIPTIFIVLHFVGNAQDRTGHAYTDINYFYGNIIRHNDDIAHLINGHPEGFIISWNKKNLGYTTWEQHYNYPDHGFSFSYQNLKSVFLGENYAGYAHYNFYFFKRNVILRIGQGIAYTTKPYHKETNFRNIAFGSRIMSSTYLMLQYKKENIIDRLGVQAGFSLIHYSNANIKAPNTSINSVVFHVGMNYMLDDRPVTFLKSMEKENTAIPLGYSIVLRTGINESDIIGSGQFPFYILSAYTDKRLNKRSAVQLGGEIFFSNFLKAYIRYRSTAMLGGNIIQGDEDYKRVGIFAGHELYLNKLSLETQLGYYIYYPVDFEGRTYIRIGLKRYIRKRIFAAVTLKSHGAKAEAVEFGIGVRL